MLSIPVGLGVELGAGACAAGLSVGVFSPRWHTAALNVVGQLGAQHMADQSCRGPCISEARVTGSLLSRGPLSCPPFSGRPATSDPTEVPPVPACQGERATAAVEGPPGETRRAVAEAVPVAADAGGRLWAGPQWGRKTRCSVDESTKGRWVGATGVLGEQGEWGGVRAESESTSGDAR